MLAYEALAIDWEGLTPWLAGANRVSQLAVGDDSRDASAHVSTTPTLEYHGRIGDWAAEVRRARDRGDTVLFVADTPGRAERITELLADYEIRAQAIADADDLSRGAVFVTTGHLSRGFHLPAAGLLMFAETAVFEEERRVHERRR